MEKLNTYFVMENPSPTFFNSFVEFVKGVAQGAAEVTTPATGGVIKNTRKTLKRRFRKNVYTKVNKH
jgi:hypothetical protein